MSDGLNKVMVLGNLGAAPELRMTQSGQAVLNMRIAVSESYLDKDKQRQERTEWVTATVWGSRAEGLAKILDKGDRVFVEGGLRTSSYEKDGVKHYRTEVHATNVILCGGRSRGDAGDRDSSSAGTGATKPSGEVRGGYATRSTSGGVAYPGVRSAGDFEIRFGDDKGKHISEVENLDGLRAFLVKGIDDPTRSQYAERNKAQVNAIDAELAKRKGGAQPGSAPADDFDGGYGSGSSDEDIPF